MPSTKAASHMMTPNLEDETVTNGFYASCRDRAVAHRHPGGPGLPAIVRGPLP